MDENLRKVFQNRVSNETDNISVLVLNKINSVSKTRAKRKSLLYTGTALLSFIGMFPAFGILMSEVKASGFFEYLSLVFFPDAIRFAGSDLVFLLAETLPAVSLALCLGLLVFMVASIYGALQTKVKTLQVT